MSRGVLLTGRTRQIPDGGNCCKPWERYGRDTDPRLDRARTAVKANTKAPAAQLARWLSAWLTETDLDVCAGEVERTGLSGALDRWRNTDRDGEDLAAFDGALITDPSLFIGCSLDVSTTWPNLSGRHSSDHRYQARPPAPKPAHRAKYLAHHADVTARSIR